MKFIKTIPGPDLAENIVETTNQTVTHLVIPAGKTVPEHHVFDSVIVVPIKGKIRFGDVDHDRFEELVPGDIVQLAPGEWHDVTAIDDAEVMVVKSKLRDEK